MSNVRLRSVITKTVGGGTPERNNPEFWNGGIPWVSVKDFKDHNYRLSNIKEEISEKGLKLSASNLIPAGTPIVCTRMAVGRIARANFPVAINQDLRALFFNDSVDTEYMVWAIDSIRNRIENLSIGSTVKGINIDQFLDFEIYDPDKPEQLKITEILSTVNQAIEQTEALIAKQQRIKTGLMQDLLTHGIDEHSNLRSEQTHQFKESQLGRIPVEWEVKTIKKLSRGRIQNGIFKKPELVGSGYKLINVSEIYQAFGIDTNHESVERLDAAINDLSKYGVSEGDLFFTRSSLVLEGIAHCNIIRVVNEPTLFECHVIRIKPDNTKIVPEFLALECQSHMARLFFMSRAKHVTMTTISQPELEELNIPVPSSLEEQHMIVDVVLSNDNVVRLNKTQLSKLKFLKTALMQDLLTGKKRVTSLLKEREVQAS